jgi:osmotically inducible protein OsmC
MQAIYTAEARVTGGRAEGHGRTTDGELDVRLRLPKELGGEGGGTNPEQLFAVGYAACFEASLSLAAPKIGAAGDDLAGVAIDSRVSLVPTVAGELRLGAELHVTLPSMPDPERAAELVRAAHGICPYSGAIRGNVDVVLTANGAPVTH